MNLLDETTTAIEKSGHDISDIVYIGSSETNHQCSWKKFRKLANVEYSNDYGAAEVATDLIIVFSDGSRMWRGEYDGSEWWEYAPVFKKPVTSKPIKRLTGGSWKTLQELNDKGYDEYGYLL